MSNPPQKLVRFDWAMKNILRDKANFDVLEGFLTCLLKEKIIILDLLESESNKDDPDKKTNRVDLKCKDSQGRQVIIEVQSQHKADYFARIVWGTSKAVVESLKRGDDYLEVTKVISVSILYHDLDYPQQNRDYLYYGNTEITGCHYNEKLQIRHRITQARVTSGDIFPEYYVICVYKFDDQIREQIDEWIYFFKHETIEADFHSPGIAAAEEKLDYLGMSRAERARYDADLDAASNLASEFATAIADGKREGRDEGLVEGEAIGIEKMVLNMLQAGIPAEQIAAIAKLPPEKIVALKECQSP